MNQQELYDLGRRYAAAWSARDPQHLAAFFAEDASFTVNAGVAAIGRDAIAAVAREYMVAFPDMVVRMDSITQDGDRVIFRWRWTGTNAGPGGTGGCVNLSGFEVLTLNANGLIAACLGHFEEAEYERQLKGAGS